jgi:phospholipid/cholesterol/gamma-HCH transport system permease protein
MITLPSARGACWTRVGDKGAPVSRIVSFLDELGSMVILFFQVLYWTFRPPYRIGLFMRALEFVGVGSLFIIVLTGSFTGAVLALQGIYAFGILEMEAMVGGSVALALARELSPVLAALMVTGRVGSAMATEIGTMRVTEQIDAMETLAVNPIQYLIVPKVWATTLMLPALCVIFTFVGMVGCYLVAVVWFKVDYGLFMAYIESFMSPQDIVSGVIKAAVFGAGLSIIGCYKGYNASGGARGVGVATTTAVVLASVMIFVFDYVLTALMFE